MRGRAKTFVEGPVDYTDLRTEFIGLIYEGLLDYRLKRTDEKIGPQVFLNLGREPVLPLRRLEDMLANDRKGLKNLLTTLRKETGHRQRRGRGGRGRGRGRGARSRRPEEIAEEEPVEDEAEPAERGGHRARRLPRRRGVGEALGQGGGRPGRAGGQAEARETDSEYQARIEAEANRLIKRVAVTGEFYLVRAGNTRKGTGTFYTRPQLAVPTVHRTLEPLCYDKAEDGTLTPKEPEIDPRPEGLRPGVRQCLVPRGGPALPDRRPLPVALPSPPPGRPGAGQEAHAALRSAPHRRGRRGTRAVPAERPAAGRHLRGAGQGPAAAARRRAVHLRRGHQPAGRGIGPCVALGRDARPRTAVLVPRPQDQGRQLAGRLLAGPGGGLPAQGVGAGRRRRQGRATHAADRDVPQGREGRQPASGRWADQAGDAEADRDAGSRAIRSFLDEAGSPPARGGRPAAGRVREAARPADRRPGRAGSPVYREIEASESALSGSRRAMDEWCAVWFWPTDEESTAPRPHPADLPRRVRQRRDRRSSAIWPPT